MQVIGRRTLHCIYAAVALASGSVYLVLDREPFGRPSPSAEIDPAMFEVSEPERPERFVFVPPGLIGPLPAPVAELRLPADPSPEPGERTTAWSIETRHEPATPPPAPRLSSLPPERLPWLMPAPRPPAVAPRSYTLRARLAEIAPTASKRLTAKFEAAKAPWPPAEVGLVAIKDEKTLELHARSVGGGAWKLIHRYPVLAASGRAGPKLRQGDKQVPEGIYAISFLNPNSAYHVSLRVNYPNAFDRQMALQDGRSNLGGDIMIHGKDVSVGCLAVGDEAAEELFVLAAEIGLPNVRLIIAPSDFRRHGVPEPDPAQPAWLPKLYIEVASAMSEFKPPPRTGLMSLFGN